MNHVLPNRNAELVLALMAIAIGCFLLWDCYDNRGQKMPWFTRWFSFW